MRIKIYRICNPVEYKMFVSLISSFLLDSAKKSNDGGGEIDASSNTVNEKQPVFLLPITYLDSKYVRPLSESVSQDLELIAPPSQQNQETVATKTMYEHLFQPEHEFAHRMLPQWSKYYSTHMPFLKDTQTVIQNVEKMQKIISRQDSLGCFRGAGFAGSDCNKLDRVCQAFDAENFLEKYNYMEWQSLKFLNESTSFLELLAVGNILSPVASLLLPILFFILPFIILKIQRVPITFDVYVTVLKQVARNHFIGKALVSWDSMSMDKIIYLIFMFGLYLMQVYQNVVAVKHMYENVQQLNMDLMDLRDFCDYSIHSMGTFYELHGEGKLSTYTPFCEELHQKLSTLKQLQESLKMITPFGWNARKLTELGDMLGIYYQIYSVDKYRNAIEYAMGFEGYYNNLIGVYRNWNSGHMSMISWSKKTKKGGRPKFKDQYYAGLVSNIVAGVDGAQDQVVRNTVSLKKNWIITGPNASGKTTLLKTTALNIIFTQQIGCGFYGEGSYMPRLYSHIHSYLNIPDTSERDSLFQAEARRCKNIIDAVDNDSTGHHFCIFDELYSGTNPKEAMKAAYGFLKYLSVRKNVDYILTTHYVDVCRRFEMEPVEENTKKHRICNYKMMVNMSKDGDYKFTYKVHRGISDILGANKILKDMNYPKEIIQDAFAG